MSSQPIQKKLKKKSKNKSKEIQRPDLQHEKARM
jgi:hypothetical protein